MLNFGAASHSCNLPQTERHFNLIKECTKSYIAYHCGRRCSRTIFRCLIDIQGRRRSALYKLSLSRRLRRSRRTQRRNYHSAMPTQTQIPYQSTAHTRKPLTESHNSKLRFLYGMPKQIRKYNSLGAIH